MTTPKGSITITGANLDVQGSIVTPGGLVNLTVFNISPTAAEALLVSPPPSAPPPNPNRGQLTLGRDAMLSAAGLIIDDRLSAPDPMSLPLVTAGGSVSVTAFDVDLNNGSVIDVSGGVRVGPTGARAYGNAGTITIRRGQDPNIKAVVGGSLHLGAKLLGYSGARGGSLTFQAPVIQIGGHSPSAKALSLDPDFFSEGGFASFTLIGLGEATGAGDEVIPGVSVAPGTIVEPAAASYVADLNPPGAGSLSLRRVLKPEGLRTPVSITLSAPGVTDDFSGLLAIRGDLVIGAGARIRTDALGSINLSGNTVAVYRIPHRAGRIDHRERRVRLQQDLAVATGGRDPSPAHRLSGARDPCSRRQARSCCFLIAGAIAPAMCFPAARSRSRETFSPKPAPRSTSRARRGFSISRPPISAGACPRNAPPLGSLLVPVTSGVTSPLSAAYALPTRVDSNGGTIALRGGQALFTAATLKGFAGGSTAVGGNLLISSDTFYAPGAAPESRTPLISTLTVTQSDPGFVSGSGGIGKPVLGASGGGQFAANYFARGGFDSLALGGTVAFSGPVTINARRSIIVAVPSSSSAVNGGVITADADVILLAPYVALGKPFRTPIPTLEEDQNPAFKDGLNQPFFPTPTYGSGTLNVIADLIDIGNLSLQRIGEANLVADRETSAATARSTLPGGSTCAPPRSTQRPP